MCKNKNQPNQESSILKDWGYWIWVLFVALSFLFSDCYIYTGDTINIDRIPYGIGLIIATIFGYFQYVFNLLKTRREKVVYTLFVFLGVFIVIFVLEWIIAEINNVPFSLSNACVAALGYIGVSLLSILIEKIKIWLSHKKDS
ncbi:hypothetical protein [Lonepinella sp. BR2930]|uniref:hypothetical protein n=1 Tax=unclassified Lonepinella TaxID=2642006 RepID=UPI003F6DBE15